VVGVAAGLTHEKFEIVLVDWEEEEAGGFVELDHVGRARTLIVEIYALAH
jgi:hypothetical protein